MECSGLYGVVAGFFCNFGDGGLEDFELRVCGSDGDSLVFDCDDHTNDSAGGQYLVTGLDSLDEALKLLLAGPLRTNDDEVHHEHHQSNEPELEHQGPLRVLGRSRRRRTHCEGGGQRTKHHSL
jgi:hypothetical protein